MMGSSRKCSNGVKIAVIMMFIFSLRIFPSSSAESMLMRDGDHGSLKKEMKMILGSSPPRCVNRCMGCRPCTPTLVVSPHRKTRLEAKAKAKAKAKATYQGDESYYLLSWKCRCRNKLYQP